MHFSFWVHNTGVQDELTVTIRDINDADTVKTQDCTIPDQGAGVWKQCNVDWSAWPSSELKQYRFKLSRVDDGHAAFWIDLVKGTGPVVG